MSTWFERQSSSHTVQLAVTAAVSGIVIAGVIFGAQGLRRKERVEELKASIPDLTEDHKAELLDEFGAPRDHLRSDKEDDRAAALAKRAQQGDYDPALIEEQLTRTATFLGPEGFAQLRLAFVIVVGLGGVGSHCTSALVRAGVSRIRVIDFDQVTLSSLNRHAVATLTDVGTPKVKCVKKRLQAVAPWVQWDCCNEIWNEQRGGHLLRAWQGDDAQPPTYVIDAIDNIDSKVALLRYCFEHDLKVISSMGAGCKSDPTRLCIGDISASIEDPLSRATRRRLRSCGISEGIPVVYSAEKPGPGKAGLLPLAEEEYQKGKVNELSVLPDFRARILPVLGTMPAVFGYTIANFVVMEITGYPHDILAGKSRDKLYDAVLSGLQGQEERMARAAGQDAYGLKLPISSNDVGYLIEEVYRGRSVISGLSTRLALTRWKAPHGNWKLDTGYEGQKMVPLELHELVCMTKEEVASHEARILRGNEKVEDVYGNRTIELVAKRIEEEHQYSQYR